MRNIVEKHDDLQKEIEEWDVTLADGLENEEEWDEDHALDQVLNDMVEDLDDEEQTQNTSSLPPVDLIEKQQQTNIPASGLINSPTEISNVTLEGKGSAQRKIRTQQKKKD